MSTPTAGPNDPDSAYPAPPSYGAAELADLDERVDEVEEQTADHAELLPPANTPRLYSGWVEMRGGGVSGVPRFPIIRQPGQDGLPFYVQGTGVTKGADLAVAIGALVVPPLRCISAYLEIFNAAGTMYGIQANEDLVDGVAAWDAHAGAVTWDAVVWGSGPTLSNGNRQIDVVSGVYGFSFSLAFADEA